MHTLLVYGPSSRADAALREAARATRAAGGRLTVLSLAAQEPTARRCCDTRSVFWNEVCEGLAHQDLAKASLALDGERHARLEVLPHSVRRAVETLVREAVARDADEIVLADPRASGLGRLERRRLRRRSPVPVSDGTAQ
jgi:hypothetical protein